MGVDQHTGRLADAGKQATPGFRSELSTAAGRVWRVAATAIATLPHSSMTTYFLYRPRQLLQG